MKRKLAIFLLAILAVSAFSFVASTYATPLVSSNTVPNTAGNAVSLQRSSVRVYGEITSWLRASTATTVSGAPTATPVTGTLEAVSLTAVDAANTVQRFAVTAIWTTNITRPIATPASAATARSLGNFTYVFDTARLVQGYFSALDFNGNAFFLNGTWDVWSITEAFMIVTNSTTGRIISVNSNLNAVPVATDAYGTLTVSSGWSSFTLSIAGVGPLTGKIVAEVTTSAIFNPIMLSTDTASTTVTSSDISSIISSYGSMPGWGSYNVNMDFCLHYKIDLCDLATAAANLNTA